MVINDVSEESNEKRAVATSKINYKLKTNIIRETEITSQMKTILTVLCKSNANDNR